MTTRYTCRKCGREYMLPEVLWDDPDRLCPNCGDKAKGNDNKHWESSGEYVLADIPCLHKSCPECNGTGNKKDGRTCIHWISCNCNKCSPSW